MLAQLSALGIRPKKGLGQNFLVDPAHRGRIVAAAGLTPDDIVLEVGPGPGVLTELIAQQAGHVVAVELDDRLIPFLRERFADRPHVEIVHGDILKLDVGALMLEAGSWKLATGNWQLVTGSWKLEAGDGRLEAGGWKPEAHSRKLADQLPVSSFQFPVSSFQYPASSFQYKVIANLPYYITSAAIRHLLESVPSPALLVLTVQREVAERMVASPPQMSLLALGVQFY
ncbi:MAG: rRNA adenine dimethyltransferase family protein, partial [Anaerolineae bacterium]